MEKFFGVFLIGHQITQALCQPATAPAFGFGPAQPAAQLGCLHRREMAGEGAVCGIKQMMAFIKHHASNAAGGCLFIWC